MPGRTRFVCHWARCGCLALTLLFCQSDAPLGVPGAAAPGSPTRTPARWGGGALGAPLGVALLAQSPALPASQGRIERVVQLRDVPARRGSIDVRVSLPPEYAAAADRIIDAAREALSQYGEWFGPYPDNHLTIVGRSWQEEGVGADPGVITVEPRWLMPPTVLQLEAQVARGISRQWWGGLVRIEGDDDQIISDGLNEYLQSRTVERIFDRRHQSLAYSLGERRYFGGFIPLTSRDVRISRSNGGLGRPVFLEAGARSLPAWRTARGALAFGTLERYLGWPTMQAALASATQQLAGRTMTRADLLRVMSETAGQDLTWFFDEAFARSRVFDYAVDTLSSDVEDAACEYDPCYRTTVTVTRNGDALFTGTSKAPVGNYEAGRALEVLVTFADGAQAVDYWDGRAPSKRLTYHSSSPAVSAQIDPKGVLLLDVDYLNNSRTLQPPARGVATTWALRWMTWLENLLLTYAFFV